MFLFLFILKKTRKNTKLYSLAIWLNRKIYFRKLKLLKDYQETYFTYFPLCSEAIGASLIDDVSIINQGRFPFHLIFQKFQNGSNGMKISKETLPENPKSIEIFEMQTIQPKIPELLGAN